MTPFSLALKRLYRKRGFAALLLLFPLCMACVSFLLPRGSFTLPAAGVFCQSPQPKTSAFLQKLYAENQDFVPMETEQALRDSVRNGTLDCGFLLSDETEAFLSGENVGAPIRLLTSPVSLRAEVFRQRLAAALTAQLSPYLCSRLLSEYDIQASVRQLAHLLETHAGRDNRFRIQLESVTGVPVVADAAALAGRSFLWGVVSLFLFACTAACASLYTPAHLRQLQLVAPQKAVWRCVVLPGLAAQCVCMTAACAAGYLLSALCGVWPGTREAAAAIAYVLFLTGLTPMLSAIFFKGRGLLFAVPPILCLSLFLCPILTDLPARFPPLGLLSVLLPTHMFFTFLNWAVPASFFFAAVFLVFGPMLLHLRLYGFPHRTKQ